VRVRWHPAGDFLTVDYYPKLLRQNLKATMIAIALSTQSSDVRSEDSVHPHDPTSGLEELRKPGIIDLAHPWLDDGFGESETCTAENASAPVTRANAALALSWAGRPLHRLICTLSSRLRSTICWPEDNNDRPTFSIVLRTAASVSVAELEAPPLTITTTFDMRLHIYNCKQKTPRLLDNSWEA
jgi:hypothetical protein